MKKTILWLVLIGFSPLQTTATTAAEIAARLEERLRALQTLQARFSQVYYGQPPALPLREKGLFYFQKPDRMRWRYEEPEPKEYLYQEGTFSSYFPEDNQLIIQKLSGEYHETEILLILAGQKSLREDYDLELVPASATGKGGVWTLKLKPRAEEEASSEILLEVDAGSRLIRRIVFRDWAGNSSEFVFQDLKADRKLDPGLFELRVPDDCEIIRDEALSPPGKQTKSPAVRIPQ